MASSPTQTCSYTETEREVMVPADTGDDSYGIMHDHLVDLALFTVLVVMDPALNFASLQPPGPRYRCRAHRTRILDNLDNNRVCRYFEFLRSAHH